MSKSYSAAFDQRFTAGDTQTMIAPGAVVGAAGGASVNAAAGSSVHTNINTTNTGMQPTDVKGLMDSVFANNQATTQTLSSLAGGMKDQAKSLTDIVGQTRVSESSQLIQLLPLLLLAAGALLVWRK